MRNRLFALLVVLIMAALCAVGVPLAIREAAAQQQHMLVDRIDDTSRFAALAQYAVVAGPSRQSAAQADSSGVPSTAAQLAELRAELSRYQEVYGIGAGVFDRNGKPLAAAPAGYRVPRGTEARLAFSEALSGRRSHDPPQVWPWQHGRLVVASPVVRDGDVVAVALTDSPTGAMRGRTLRAWALIGAGVLVAMLVASYAASRLAGWALRPVNDLDRATHEIATGRMQSRAEPVAGPPELRRLARAFNEMADHVEDVLRRQRAFVADASHQLRNPLAALLLRLDVLGMGLPEGHEEELADVRAEGRRLSHVLDDLLRLALAEHPSVAPRSFPVRPFAEERARAWRDAAERAGVTLACAVPDGLTVHVDPVLVGSALDVVLDNAVKYSPRGGTVEVRAEPSDDRLVLAVVDSGPGLTDAELERVGDRFWRGSRGSQVDGSGLGLSIASRLLAACGGQLRFRNRRGERSGLVVELVLPTTLPQTTQLPGGQLPDGQRSDGQRSDGQRSDGRGDLRA